MKLEDLATWAFLGAGIGRLVAKDTILLEPRNALLRRLVIMHCPQADTPKDWGDECRKGIAPFEDTNGIAVAVSPVRGRVAAGVTCPSCVSWWALLVARVVMSPGSLLTRRGWFDQFATWGLASAITRKAP